MNQGLHNSANGSAIRKMLDHIGEPSMPPKISQARGPPLLNACDAEQIKVFDAEPEWAIEKQIGPDVQFDQSVNW